MRTAPYKNDQFSGYYGHIQKKGDIRQVIITKDLGERDGQTYMNSVT